MALLSCSLQLVQVLTNTARWRWVERVLVPSPELPKKKGKSPKIYNLFSEVFLIVSQSDQFVFEVVLRSNSQSDSVSQINIYLF